MVVAELAAELVAAPLDRDVLAELVAIVLVAAVVAELAIGVLALTASATRRAPWTARTRDTLAPSGLPSATILYVPRSCAERATSKR
jgi:hypothetical protein